MRITVNVDGTLMVDEPHKFVTKSYSPDPNDPHHFIPKFEPCQFRRLELRVMNCGRRNAYWHCDLYKRHTCVTECQQCEVPIEQRRSSGT